MGRTLSEWFSSLPVFALLLATLIIGTGEMVHGQLLKLGESMFGDKDAQVQYFMLRTEPEKPTCTIVTDIDAEIAKQSAAPSTPAEDDIDSMFGDTKTDPAVLRKSIEQANEICKTKLSMYQRAVGLDLWCLVLDHTLVQIGRAHV